jgi:hypothetical protein
LNQVNLSSRRGRAVAQIVPVPIFIVNIYCLQNELQSDGKAAQKRDFGILAGIRLTREPLSRKFHVWRLAIRSTYLFERRF